MAVPVVTITHAQKFLQLIHQRYPAWNTFEDPRLIRDELDYKRQAIQKAADLLSKERYQELLQVGDHEEIISLLKKIAQGGKNLLYLASGKSSDIGVLYRDDLDQASFCRQFYNFLFDIKPSPERMDVMVDYLTDNKLPARWSFLTYYLFLYFPDQDIYCKPGMMKWFLSFVGYSLGLANPPSQETYSAVLGLCKQMSMLLDPRPRDMVELHSLIWVAYSERGKELGSPFNEFFENWEQATQGLDLFAEVLRKLGITSPNDRRFSITMPSFRSGRRCLRLDYGRGTPLDFERKGNSVTMVHIGLAGKYDLEPRFAGWLDKNYLKPGEDDYRFELVNANDSHTARYTLPFERLLMFLEDHRDQILDPVLVWYEKEFSDYRSSPYRVHNVSQIAQALFNPTLRDRLLTEGLTETGEGSDEPLVASDAAFSPGTYSLLEGIHATPKYTYYKEHEEDFKQLVEAPFQRLMGQVSEGLPEPIKARMELHKDLFSRFYKNDYGKGGAWDFYWGALYPKDGRRTADPQLAIWMDYQKLHISFHIGDYGDIGRQRFRRNCLNYSLILPNILADLVHRPDIILAHESSIIIDPDNGITTKAPIPWQEWFHDPAKSHFSVGIYLTKQEVLALPATDLVKLIQDFYIEVFPLVLLAIEEDPMPSIRKYLGLDEGESSSINEPYTLEAMCQDTGIEQSLLDHWVRAIHHKGQAVLYGPPGTGKTYLAERLARHLIGGGDGFSQIIQFHPEYSYEEFIQGIRPRPHPMGGLDYPMEAGRFKEFCAEASARQGTCVLVIDEINRANLARVFGELMFLLEYRERSIPLAGGGNFKIPANIRMIGTMNTADRSIALVDHALRRRFAFLGLFPDYEILKRFHEREMTGFDVTPLIKVLMDLNALIRDRHYMIGVSYFLQADIQDRMEDIWRMEIEPYLEEYFYGQEEKIRGFRWETVRTKL